MLSYDDALERILEAVPVPLPAEEVPVGDAQGRALARDLTADTDLPPFANSAVDGYAVHVRDTEAATLERPVALPVTQTVAAGYAPERPVLPGEAARIFTGAPLPEGADGLVMVEDTSLVDTTTIFLHRPASRQFIRPAGSDLRRGQRALAAGASLDAGEIGLLSALNHTRVLCARRPRVALLTTGDEVVPPGLDPLTPGQIRDANGPALAAAARTAGAVVMARLHARDDADAVRAAFDACAGADVIVASGGVSVGAFDYVTSVLKEAGELAFWRIAIKPGKPLAFGRLGDAVFFGLPGNPVSSLVTFELFVRPVLRRLAGHRAIFRPRVSAVLTTALPHAPGRREFVRAALVWQDDTYQATPTGAQGSHRLASLTDADALLIADEDHGGYAAGDRLPAMLLV